MELLLSWNMSVVVSFVNRVIILSFCNNKLRILSGLVIFFQMIIFKSFLFFYERGLDER